MSITLICYLGFIARDLLLVRVFGVTARLDGYFFAAMLPMFVVSSLAMPIADAFMRFFVSIYLNEGLPAAGRLARQALWRGVLWLSMIALALGIFAEPIMRMGLKSSSPAEIAQELKI